MKERKDAKAMVLYNALVQKNLRGKKILNSILGYAVKYLYSHNFSYLISMIENPLLIEYYLKNKAIILGSYTF